MDRHVRWLRRRIVPRVLLRLLVEWFLVVDVALIGLLFGGLDPFVALPWALLAGFVWLLVRVGVALIVNPINWPFLSRYIDEPISVSPMSSRPDDATDDSDLPFLASHNLEHQVDLQSHDSYVSVYASPDGRVLAVLGPGETVPTFVSLLTDGRLLVTGNQLIVPHEELVVNHDRRRDARWLVERHVDLLEELHGVGLSPEPADAESVARLMRVEHDGWAQLGPFLGPFLDIGSRFAPHLLTVRVPSAAMLERTRVAPQGTIAVAVPEPVMSETEPAEESVDEAVDGEAPSAEVEAEPPVFADEGAVMTIGRRAAEAADSAAPAESEAALDRRAEDAGDSADVAA